MAVYTPLLLFQIPSSCEWGGACDSSWEPLRRIAVEPDYCNKKKIVVTYILQNLLTLFKPIIYSIHTSTTDMNFSFPLTRAKKFIPVKSTSSSLGFLEDYTVQIMSQLVCLPIKDNVVVNRG